MLEILWIVPGTILYKCHLKNWLESIPGVWANLLERIPHGATLDQP